ncbi:uncharacterized protein FIBRA_06358 [Fibroporia radiculosa]|uniref:Uncharacterized protein n=1 Tax=Fibroporia radiculosa TaxID=599839 RepID=J4HYZ3_9APHY|nr:uncharacterized protein FIBRA_06358 [Fibroporia radiculosa]CCM04192.1 predicted protein [Fibroporia radiculosa]
MADRAVRTHTNPSNRANARDQAERKVIFRSVLDNPFRVPWPSVPINVQNSILARVADMAVGVSEYHLAREKASRRRKRTRESPNAPARKMQRLSSPGTSTENVRLAGIVEAMQTHHSPTPMSASQAPEDTTEGESNGTPGPPILQHLTFGVNEVTKLLEKRAQSYRHVVTVANSTPKSSPQAEQCACIILVCRGDVDPPMLLQHFPQLVAACNSRRPTTSEEIVWLIALPKGAESTLADAMGLRRVSVLAIAGSAPDFVTLLRLVEKVSVPRAPWLTQVEQAIEPTHIKQLRTTAPKDMKSAKEQRAKRTRSAGKSTVSDYLIKTKGFLPVRLYTENEESEHASMLVSPMDASPTSSAESDDLFMDEPTPNPIDHRLSFLSMASPPPSALPSPAPGTHFGRLQPLWFASPSQLLQHVTRNWRTNFVTADLATRRLLEPFITRPFFMIISVDAPLMTRFKRENQ